MWIMCSLYVFRPTIETQKLKLELDQLFFLTGSSTSFKFCPFYECDRAFGKITDFSRALIFLIK